MIKLSKKTKEIFIGLFVIVCFCVIWSNTIYIEPLDDSITFKLNLESAKSYSRNEPIFKYKTCKYRTQKRRSCPSYRLKKKDKCFRQDKVLLRNGKRRKRGAAKQKKHCNIGGNNYQMKDPYSRGWRWK